MTMIRILTVFVLLLTMPGAATAAGPHIVVDVRDGSIFSESNSHDRWYPASLTKLMTAYVTFRALAAGEVADGSPVVISKTAARQPPSKMGYKIGVRLRVDTALKIILVKSANDVSVALAESIAGTVAAFAQRMNEETRRLGMRNSQFINPHGLHSSKQYTSAADMAILSTAIWREFPQYRDWFEAVGVKTAKKTHYSYNLLLERFDGATGMKTGFVCASGYNMVASAERNGRHLVAVVMGAESQTDRAVRAAKLLKNTFLTRKGPIGNLARVSGDGSRKPVNMRPILCTEKARKARYEPGAGQAVIRSEHLSERVHSNTILQINTGGIDGDPSAAFMARAYLPSGNLPFPVRRPDYTVFNVDGDPIGSSLALRRSPVIPQPRPKGF